MTVAMCLANHEEEISTQWEHDPALCDTGGRTVAMYLAWGVKEIPTRWEHDPTL